MARSETLIIVIHPNLDQSAVSKSWIQELGKSPDKFVIHDLYGNYPNGIIDVEKEQKLMESYDKIIFQFPFYWFNCPPLFNSGWMKCYCTVGPSAQRVALSWLEKKCQWPSVQGLMKRIISQPANIGIL